ncbi:MAG: DUF58 domain-containing protein [Proteobacteria bacterium]|nr:DUF58 domain-containing protein [Pseudomonadota bacterium]
MTADGLVAARRAEEISATLPPLLLAAQRIAATVSHGVHGRRRVGPGDTFWQFRRYHVGDPPQSIDWRQSAKSDRVYVREREWEAAQSVWLWRDASASMRYRSSAGLPTKLERAELLLLAVASLLVRGGERVALLGGGERPSSSRGQLNRLALALAIGQGLPGRGLPGFEPVGRHGRVLWIGDFLAPIADTEAILGRYAHHGVRGHLLQILDPAEETLPFAGRVRFEGLEEEGEALIERVEAVRGDYGTRLAALKAGLAALSARFDWTFAVHHTDRPPQEPLLILYTAISEASDLLLPARR